MTFHEGQDIRCPGTRHDRRERQRDTERRADPRLGPCHHRWGRVGAGCETWIRVRRQGQPPMGVPSALLDCPTCHQPIELATIAASKAA